MDGEVDRNNRCYGKVDFDDDMKASEASALTDEGEARVPTNVWASFWVSVLQLFALLKPTAVTVHHALPHLTAHVLTTPVCVPVASWNAEQLRVRSHPLRSQVSVN